MTHEECREALALGALGALESPEQDAVGAHVARCPACAAELAELEEAAASLARLEPPLAPSPEHLARVLAALDADARRRRPWRRLASPGRLAVAAAVLVLIGADVALYRRLERASAALAGMRRVGAFVTSPDVVVVSLWGGGARSGAHAKLAYDRVTGRFVLLSSDLAPPPPGAHYQLWVIGDGVRPAAAFHPDAPAGVLTAPPRGDAPVLFGLSVEPAGTTDEPTGPMVLVSEPVRATAETTAGRRPR